MEVLPDDSCLNQKDHRGNSPLQYAILYANICMATFLVNAGADVNLIDAKGRSLLDLLDETLHLPDTSQADGRHFETREEHSLVVCDESGHTKFPFSFAILSWGELRLICPELPLILP
jgi:ankyrin repeat protein